jgi:hypothetical protein
MIIAFISLSIQIGGIIQDTFLHPSLACFFCRFLFWMGKYDNFLCASSKVFFNFVVQRIVLFHVLGFMFPRRAKARIIHLYNKMIFARVNVTLMEEAVEKDKNEHEEEGKEDDKDNKLEEDNEID